MAGRGRPKSDKPALTNAERQRQYKERLKQQLSLVTENNQTEQQTKAKEIVSSLGLETMSDKDSKELRCMLIMHILLETFGEQIFLNSFMFALDNQHK